MLGSRTFVVVLFPLTFWMYACHLTAKPGHPYLLMREMLKSSRAAIDLASIMVGIIVIGLIGAVIAATIFAVIPWAQDNAAKQQLDAVKTAETAYAGLAADNQVKGSSGKVMYGSAAGLQEQNLLDSESAKTMIAVGPNNSCYLAVMKSASGKFFWIDSLTQKVQLVSDSSVSNCADLPSLVSGKPVGSLVLTIDTTDAICKSYELPVYGNVNIASLDWGDGVVSQSVKSDGPSHVYSSDGKKTITVTGTFDGYGMKNAGTFSSNSYQKCTTAVLAFNNTGTTRMVQAFANTNRLTKVVEIPKTVTSLSYAFYQSNFNDASVLNWDVSHVTDFSFMFHSNTVFNQPIGSWNMKSATMMNDMFTYSSNFNQDISGWDVSSVTNMAEMFWGATSFNQNIGVWNTGSLVNADNMMRQTSAFNQDLTAWNVTHVTSHITFNLFSALPDAKMPHWVS
jgi:surface protein